MNYSEEFKAKVREVYGEQFNDMLASGSEILGRYLDDASQGGISVDTILLATSLDKLQADARKFKIKKELYSEFSKQRRKLLFPNDPSQWT